MTPTSRDTHIIILSATSLQRAAWQSLLTQQSTLNVWGTVANIDELAEIGYHGRICPVFYGEPLLEKRLVDFMRYIRTKLPKSWIEIYTNGDLLTPEKYSLLQQAGVDLFFITQHDQTITEGVKNLYKYLKSNGYDLSRISYQKFYLGSKLLCNRGGLIHLYYYGL